MAGDELDPADRSGVLERLDSWKEIAAYLKRDVTTVRRWEKREGLPVHRHLHERRDSVYAHKQEVDAWWDGRRNHLVERAASNGDPNGNDNGSTASARARTISSAFSQRAAGWAVAALLLLSTLSLGALLFARSRGTANLAERRFSIHPPPDTSFGAASLSPDGRYLAFTATAMGNGGHARLWIRSQDDVVPHALPDTEDASFPFWSPSSDAIGFFAAGKLWTVSIDGGSPRPVADAPAGRGGTWNQHGVIVFAPSREDTLLRVPAAGGEALALTTVGRPEERGHIWPEFLPDGNRFLYLADSNEPEHHALRVGSLDGTISRRLFPLASSVEYTRDGFLFFALDRKLVAQRFDEQRLELEGEPITLADGVQQRGAFDHKADVAVSDDGVLVYRARQSSASRLVWRDRSQRRSTFIETPGDYYCPTLSPDEQRVAFTIFAPNPSKRFGYGTGTVTADIWVADRRTGSRAQLTTDPAADWGPVWSPDGRWLVYSSNRRRQLELFQRDLTLGNADEVPLPTTGKNPVAQSWSPDGRYLLYSAFDPTLHFDLWLLPMTTDDRAPTPLLRTEASENQGQISPDGRWFAYTSNVSGVEEVYVQSFPSAGPQVWKVSTTGGGDPRWRRDGLELFYVGADRQFMSVAVKPGLTFDHGVATPLFDTGVPPSWYEARNLYDVSRDGSFLFMTPVEDDRAFSFTMVFNWMAGRRP